MEDNTQENTPDKIVINDIPEEIDSDMEIFGDRDPTEIDADNTPYSE